MWSGVAYFGGGGGEGKVGEGRGGEGRDYLNWIRSRPVFVGLFLYEPGLIGVLFDQLQMHAYSSCYYYFFILINVFIPLHNWK